MVRFIEFWPGVYYVLTERILKTKEMGLIFHNNGKKSENGIKDKTD